MLDSFRVASQGRPGAADPLQASISGIERAFPVRALDREKWTGV